MSASTAARGAPRIVVVTGTTPGLRADAVILQSALGAGSCRTYAVDESNRWRREARLWRRACRALGGAREPIVFMESGLRAWMRTARTNVLVPNLEWVYPETEATIGDCDVLWCKSRDAERRLLARGLPAVFLGFSSRDRLDRTVAKDWNRFLHLAGRSPLKGTAAVLRAWAARPDWPPLTLVARPDVLPPSWSPPPNVRLLSHALDDAEIGALMNACGIHLCPSEAEGYGHYIGEAMSCGSVVLTTDAPPMNEHLGAGEGLLLRWSDTRPLAWGQRYVVGADAIADAVDHVLELAPDARAATGARARRRYEAGRQAFTRRARELAAAL